MGRRNAVLHFQEGCMEAGGEQFCNLKGCIEAWEVDLHLRGDT